MRRSVGLALGLFALGGCGDAAGEDDGSDTSAQGTSETGGGDMTTGDGDGTSGDGDGFGGDGDGTTGDGDGDGTGGDGDGDGTTGDGDGDGTTGDGDGDGTPMPFAALDVGWHTSCAIDDVGGLWCWGRNHDGVGGQGAVSIAEGTPLAVGTDTWSSVSVGYRFACGIRADQSLWCWGYQADGRLGDGMDTSGDVPAPQAVGTQTDWATVSTTHGSALGSGHACGTRDDGTLWCWGSNTRGQLGTGDTMESYTPIQTGTETDWAAVSAGVLHTCGVKTDGRGYCWGFNTGGRLGEFVGSESLVPVEAVAGATWLDLDAGGSASCGVRTDGTLWCWGSLTPANGAPEQLGTETDWVRVDYESGRFCGVRGDGSAWCVGDNTFGQMGIGGAKWFSTLEQVPPPAGGSATWQSIRTSESHSCGLDDGGRVRCFGSNFYGELGRGTSALVAEPTPLAETDWSDLETSTDTGCGLRGDALYCWGQTGLVPADYTAVPVEMSEVGFDRLEAGREAMCGIKADDTLWCWGRTYFEPVGMTGVGFRNTPTQLVPGTAWQAIGFAGRNSCAVQTNGTLWCWGRNDFGQAGNGTTDQVWDLTQVGTDSSWGELSGGGHTGNDGSFCSTKTDGTLWCWGGAVAERLTGSPTPEVTAPAQVGTDTDWAAAELAWGHACFFKTGGEMFCAGRNDRGQLGDPARSDPDWTLTRLGTDTWNGASLGDRMTVAIRADGTLWTWGDGRYGQLGNGTVSDQLNTPLVQDVPQQVGTATDWVEVQVSTSVNTGRHAGGQVDAWGWGLEGAHGLGQSWSSAAVPVILP